MIIYFNFWGGSLPLDPVDVRLQISILTLAPKTKILRAAYVLQLLFFFALLATS